MPHLSDSASPQTMLVALPRCPYSRGRRLRAGRQTAAPGRGGPDCAGPTGAAVLSSLLTRPLAKVCPAPACLSPLWALSLVCCPKHGPHTLLYERGGGQRPGRQRLGWTPGKSASRASVPLLSVGHVVVIAHSWPGLGWQCPL